MIPRASYRPTEPLPPADGQQFTGNLLPLIAICAERAKAFAARTPGTGLSAADLFVAKLSTVLDNMTPVHPSDQALAAAVRALESLMPSHREEAQS